MIFRQLFDATSCTYTYLLASRPGGEALIIDPVLDKVDRYVQLLAELDLRLVKALDTHLHADHITALGALRDRTRCVTVMGERSSVDVVSMRVADGDRVGIEGLTLDVLYTPGHTDDSYCFRMADRVFTGDTLLIRGTGRTDFQNGDAVAQYHSLFDRLLELPDATAVYPAHDYKGDTVSTIGEERAFNPRLQVASVDEYVELMAGLNLANPKMMDQAVPANMHIGLPQVDWSWGLIGKLVPTAFAMFVVILAQSAATSRAYAARYNESFNANTDLVGLGMANIGAGLSGTFVVCGSPTKTQMVDGAGGRTQLSLIVTSVIVLLVLLFLTGPLAFMPEAVLSAVVFLIGIDLIDINGMRRIYQQRRSEFWPRRSS